MRVHPLLDDYQRQHGWLALPIAVLYKFFDDQGSYLASLITYYGFLSLFPLLLLAVTVLGFVLHGDARLQHEIVGSALAQFPIIGKQLRTNLHGYTGSGLGLAVGLLGAVYGGLGVAQAGQNAMNAVWAVPRDQRPDPLRSRLRSLVALATLGVGALLTTTLSGLTTSTRSFGGSLPPGWLAPVLGIAVSLVLNLGLFVAAFRLLTDRAVSVRDILPGAVVAAAGWQVLQAVGTYYLAHKLKGSSEVYGLFGIVLGLVAWIHLESMLVVLAAELNVVLRQRLWPRALLTPFTDDVDLTRADKHAYTSYAKAQRNKGFETINVDFHEDARRSSAPRKPPGRK